MSHSSQKPSIDILEARLFGSSNTQSPSHFLETAREWAKAVATAVGLDGKAASSITPSLAPYLAKVRQHLGKAEASVVLNEVAEAVEAQLALATYLHEYAEGISDGSGFFKNDTFPETAQIRNPLSLIAFLRRPVSTQTVNAFVKEQPSFPEGQAEAFHKSFWAMPFTRKVAFISSVLGADPRSPKHRTFKETVLSLLRSGIIEDFLPPDQPQYGAASAHQIGKKIAQGHVLTAPPALLATSLVSIMDAIYHDMLDQQSTAPRTRDPEKRFGFRLGRFMNNHGPGAHKAAQLGHSLPGANENWLEGLAGSKASAGRPTRLEFLQWVETLPPAFKNRIVRIGAHRGTGSWVSTYAMELQADYLAANPLYAHYLAGHSDKGLVLSLLKPDAKERGMAFIAHLLQLGTMLGHLSQEAYKNVAPLMEIIKQAAGIVDHETDLRNSRQQEDLAREFLEKIGQLVVGGHTYTLYTQDAFDLGQKFRVSIDIKGAHFNSLPEDTEVQRIYKRQTATMLFTVSALMRLRGEQFNHDMHGNNVSLGSSGTSTQVGFFDSGALDTRRPSPGQIETFADCLVNAAINSQRNGYGFLSSLKHTIAKTAERCGSERQADLDFINAVLRASISDGDYIRYMRGNDFVQAGLAILAASGINQTIISRVSYRCTSIAMTRGSDHILSWGHFGKTLRHLKNVLSPYARFRSTERFRLRLAIERDDEGAFYPHNPNPLRTNTVPRKIAPVSTPPVNRKPGGKMKVRLLYWGTSKPCLSGHVLRLAAKGLQHIL